MSATTCTTCTTSDTWCGPGREWNLPVGPCLNCRIETHWSCQRGWPHCRDCREPQPLRPVETENQAMARTYSHAGMKIFPLWWIEDGRCTCHAGRECSSPGKHPLYGNAHPKGDPLHGKCKYGGCGKIGHGLYDATDDPAINAARWAETPNAGIGGPAHGNGFAILDVDSKSGGLGSVERLNGRCRKRGIDLDDTLMQTTGQYPAGRGFHLFFGAPPEGIKGGAKNFGPEYPGLDIRGRGHYVVLAPTLHFTGVQYEWMDFFAEADPWPSPLTDYLNTRLPATPVVTAPSATGTSAGGGYAAKALANEIAEVRATKEGNRNNRLNKAAFNIGQLVASGDLHRAEATRELTAAGLAIGLAAKAVDDTVESGMSNGERHPRQRRRA